MLTSLAEHYGFDIDAPFEELSDEHRQKILFGSGTEEISFTYINDRGDNFQRKHPFEGVIPNMDRRYKETESQTVREELSKFLNSQSCPDCAGTRLRKEARNVFILDNTLPEITAMPVGAAREYFTELELSGRRGQIAEKILKEINDRLRFLVDVGLNYLTLDRSADTLSAVSYTHLTLPTICSV